MKTVCLALLALAAILIAAGTSAEAPAPADAKVAYSNKTCGFSITPPDFGVAANGTFMPVAFAAPAKNGFGSNVNVMIQLQKVTRNQYLEITKGEIKRNQGKFNSAKELMVDGREAVIVDYEATISSQHMHFLALVVIDTDRVYLVTCTALATEFPNVKADFQKCLESFKLDGSPKI